MMKPRKMKYNKQTNKQTKKNNNNIKYKTSFKNTDV